MKTFFAKSHMIKHEWHTIDADQQILGRLSTKVAQYLRGKHKAEYTPGVDIGDYVIVLNASKIAMTGNKFHDKIYYHHSGYIGGIKATVFKELIIRHPERIIEFAVKGMLPKGPLGRAMFRKLKVYAGNKHKHTAQECKILYV